MYVEYLTVTMFIMEYFNLGIERRRVEIKLFKLDLIILPILLILGLIGCQQKEDLNKEMTAKKYLEKQGYEVISYEQQQESYKLTEEKLESAPYNFYWSLPGNDAKRYFDKTVFVEKFIVKNHPLDNWENDGIKSKGKVNVYVFVVDGKVVGGTSYPFIPENSGLRGAYWSLDGRNE